MWGRGCGEFAVKRIGLFVAATILAAFAATLFMLPGQGPKGAEAAVPAGSTVPYQGGAWNLHGANMAWYNWACDFGCGPNGGVSSTGGAMGQRLAQAQQAGLRNVRWWMFEGNAWQVTRDASGMPTGINPAVYTDLDAALALARQYDLYYTLVLFNFPGDIPQSWVNDPVQRQKLAEVLAPLGMGATVWEREEVPPGRLAMGHVVRAGRPALQPPTRHGALDAAGGLFSTVEDLARLVAVQLAAWPPRGGAEAPPLARQTLREGHVLQAMGGFRARTQPRELAPSGVDAGVAGVGLGWRVGHDCELGHVVSHSGAVDGYHANLRLLPQEGVGIVVLANSSWADTEAVAREIQRALGRGGGLQGRAPEAAPELARATGQALELFEKWDDAAFAALSTAALRGAAGEIGGRLSWLRARLGACELGALKRASSAWSGVFVLACERGAAELTLALTTARAPKIASVSLAWIGGTPEPAVAEAAGAAAALLDRFDEASYRARFSIGVARTGFEGAAAALRFELGACRLGDAIEVSGPDAAVFAVVCERGPAKLALTLERGHAGLIGGLKVEPAGPAPACR